MAESESGIGAWIPRWEDHRLLTGQGRYTDDHNLDGQLHAAFVRSPHAHATFGNINVSAAQTMKGVIAIYSAADLEADGINVLPSDVAERGPLYPNKDGTSMPSPPYYPLARERVRHVGDAVAVVIAETPEIAAEAAEKVQVKYKLLPAVTDTAAARDDNQPQLWPEAPKNTCFDWVAGNEAATDQALAEAAHVVTVEVIDNRVVICFMEPRGILADFDTETEKFTLYIGCQGVHVTRDRLSVTLGIDPDQIRVISRDVGGGFGSRSFTYPEYAVVTWASRKLGRPVKWLATRAEDFTTANQGRDYIMRGTLGLNEQGDFLALKVSGVCSLGAYLAGSSPFTALRNVTRMLPGIYKTPLVHLNLAGVFTNTVPIASYRGVGRVEAIYTLERLIDEAARHTGLDRVELRRRNAVPPEAMPYTSPVGSTYDSGEYEANMMAALSRANWDNFETRRNESIQRGRRRGIGICNYIEGAGGVPKEYGRVVIRGDDTVLFSAGSVAQGQGHETTFRQIVAEQLGISIDCIEMVESDSELIKTGVGTNASRSIVRAGPALVEAADKAIKSGQSIAADLLEAAQADISFANGHYVITGTDRSISMFEVARTIDGASSEHRPGHRPGLA